MSLIQDITPTEVYVGKKDVTTAGIAEVLGSSQPCSRIKICSKEGNTGNVHAGNENVALTNGMKITAGVDSGWFPIDNVNKIYVDVTTSADGVTYIALN